MPTSKSKQSVRARIVDSSERPEADLESQFFDPTALANILPTPVILAAETTQRQPAATHQGSNFSFNSVSVSTRAKSPSPPRPPLLQTTQAPPFRQEPFEPLNDDFVISPPNLSTTSVIITARICEWTAADTKNPSDCLKLPDFEPASAADLESTDQDSSILPGDRLPDPTPVQGQPTTKSQQVPIPNMATLDPSSAYRLTGQRSVTQEQAKEQQKIIEQKLSRANQPSPPYDFVDLIGKGSFGRVYLG